MKFFRKKINGNQATGFTNKQPDKRDGSIASERYLNSQETCCWSAMQSKPSETQSKPSIRTRSANFQP